MATLEEILKEEYEKSIAELMDPRSLLALIEETMESVSVLNEATQQLPLEFGEKFKNASVEFTYNAIPEIPVSELGWATLDSNDEGARAKREQLQQFLGGVKGQSIREKIKQLNNFLNDPSKIAEQSAKGTTNGEKIAATLSYLVFFKTLTEIITNFNAASAGFNFESFLAVLLGGSQIATGNKTIADFTDADGTPISLKLYAEKSAKAGGSWTDLVNDLVKASARGASRSGTGKGSFMTYIVATKELEGEGFEKRGIINFYQYVLTLDNIVQIMYHSADEENSYSIRLPEKFIDGEEDLMSLEKPTQPTQQDIESIFVKTVQDNLGSLANLEQLLLGLDYSKNKTLFRGGKIGLATFNRGVGKTTGFTRGWDGAPTEKAPVLLYLLDAVEKGLIDEEELPKVWSVFYNANEIATEKARHALELYKKYREGAGPLGNAEDSVAFYNRLSGQEKQRALLFTSGYQGREQYELRKGDIKNIGQLAAPFPAFGSKITGTRDQKEVYIGSIEIGRTKVQEMLNEVVNEINQNMFILFNNVKILNDSLQAYFAGALANNDLADSAIDASLDISKKTEEIKLN